ncbi:MAG TPA: alpha/beta fold hydrolase, partial [Steroidobacteraceae bacterium]
YMRELRALALAGQRSEPPEWATLIPDLQESAGFALTAATRAALGGIDLLKQQRPASRMLVIDRDDMPPNSAWAEHLRTAGAEVEHVRAPGFTEMMLDSHEAVVPTAMIASTLAWLGTFADTSFTAPTSNGPTRLHAQPDAEFDVLSANGKSVRVRESALFPHSSQTLFGVVTEPVNQADGKAPLILLLNSGAVHHIGPNRLHVLLARRWAADGAIVLRMDLSGLGDSDAHPDGPENDVYTTHASEDIHAAIRHMRTRNAVGDCHAMGLCSGAYHSFKFAVSSKELKSVVAINPLTFSWKAGMTLTFPEHRIAADAMRYRKNAFQWASWKKLLSGGVDIHELVQVLLRRTFGVIRNGMRNTARWMRIPMSDDLGSELQRLAKQHTDLLFVFAEGDPGLDLLRGGSGSVYDRLLRRGLLRVSMVEGADHTFTPYWSRERLIAILSAHIQSRQSARS